MIANSAYKDAFAAKMQKEKETAIGRYVEQRRGELPGGGVGVVLERWQRC